MAGLGLGGAAAVSSCQAQNREENPESHLPAEACGGVWEPEGRIPWLEGTDPARPAATSTILCTVLNRQGPSAHSLIAWETAGLLLVYWHPGAWCGARLAAQHGGLGGPWDNLEVRVLAMMSQTSHRADATQEGPERGRIGR